LKIITKISNDIAPSKNMLILSSYPSDTKDCLRGLDKLIRILA
jgi:hypothetical protein